MVSVRMRLLAKATVLALLVAATGWLAGIRLPWVLAEVSVPVALVGFGGAMLGSAWWRQAAWVVAGLWSLLIAVVGLTPVPALVLNRLVADDGLAPADVIVVLSANNRCQSLSTNSLDRMLTGMRLLRAGVAPRIVFTADPASADNRFDQLAPQLLADLHADLSGIVPFEPVPVRRMTTHTEALSIRHMAERHGWRRVLVVTSPGHTRRARATFRAAQLDASVTPALTSNYDRFCLRTPVQRFEAMKEISYECAAWLFYELTGRL